MEYTIREIEKKDNQAVENIIRTCLIEFGANHEGIALAYAQIIETDHFACDVHYIKELK